MNLRIKRFDKKFGLPEAEPRAAGFDLYCRTALTIPPHEVKLVPVNIAVEVPEGYFLLLAVRSSTPLKKGLLLANGVGIVDPFYRGDKDEIQVELLNFTDKPVQIVEGELLTQGIIMKYESVAWNEVDSFGHDGHGGYQIEE